jgi:hypothetical protein
VFRTQRLPIAIQIAINMHKTPSLILLSFLLRLNIKESKSLQLTFKTQWLRRSSLFCFISLPPKNSMSHRISLATQFTGNYQHLKRKIKIFLKSKRVGHILQTTQVNDGEKLTHLFMEGESTSLYIVQKELVSHLHSIFPDIVVEEWQEMVSDTPLLDSHIAPTTPGSLSRDSSGFVEELEETSGVQTQKAKLSKWKDYFGSGFIQVVTAIQNGRQVAYEIQSSMDSIKAKFVHFTYRGNTICLNIGGCVLWTQLLQTLQECKDLEIKTPIKRIYSLVDGNRSYVQDWLGFMSEGHYYIETELGLTTMEEFFVKLKTDQDMSNVQIDTAKEKFADQGITFKQLMATGDLCLTDAELKDYGIAQGGLRKAILAVIKKYQ